MDEVNGVPMLPVARNTADEMAIKLGDWTGCPRPQKASEGGRENRRHARGHEAIDGGSTRLSDVVPPEHQFMLTGFPGQGVQCRWV